MRKSIAWVVVFGFMIAFSLAACGGGGGGSSSTSDTSAVACTSTNLQGSWINGTYNGQPTSNNANISFSSSSWNALWGGNCTEDGTFTTSGNNLALNIVHSGCGDAGTTMSYTCSISGSKLTMVSGGNNTLAYTKQ